jgi:hypothetical protein
VRVLAAAVAVLAGTIVPAVSAAPIKPVPPVTILPLGTATAAATPAMHGATAALTLTVRAELQCGRPSAGRILVSFPGAFHVPAHIGRRSTRIDDGLPSAVAVSAHVVALTVPPVRGLTCDSIAPGIVRVVFLRRAGLINPAHAGLYAISIRVGSTTAVAHLRVH